MKNIVEYSFPTLRTSDIVTHINSIALDTTATVTVSDLAANSGGLFSLQEDANGDLALSCAKELGIKLTITDSQNTIHTAEPFIVIAIAGTTELVGSRPTVQR
jgi:hypothetical protein